MTTIKITDVVEGQTIRLHNADAGHVCYAKLVWGSNDGSGAAMTAVVAAADDDAPDCYTDTESALAAGVTL